MKYEAQYSGNFKKDFKRCQKRGLDMSLLHNIVEKLCNDEPLDAKHNVHKLSGKYKDMWECHIQPDWLLVWMKLEDQLILLFTGTGTHSDLY